MKASRVLADLRRRVLVHRRLLAALFAATATWLVAQSAAAPPPATTAVWTAARDLRGGTVLTRADVARTGFAPGSVPAASVRSVDDLLGRTLAAPLGRGEPITSTDLTGAERLAGYPGRSAVAVRVPDADVVALLTPGQHVALVATDPQGGQSAEIVAGDAAVLAVPRAGRDSGPAALGGRLVVFAVPTGDAGAVLAAATSRYLGVVWNR